MLLDSTDLCYKNGPTPTKESPAASYIQANWRETNKQNEFREVIGHNTSCNTGTRLSTISKQ